MPLKLLIILALCFQFSGLQAQVDKGDLPKFSKLSNYDLFKVDQQKKVKINTDDKPLSLFIFLSPECPLSQKYTKTLNELQQKYKQQVQFVGIVSGSAYTQKEVAEFVDKYKINYSVYIDSERKLSQYLQATVTPQVILLNRKYNLVYTGAIDDWVQSLGKTRLKATEKYAEDAIEQSLNGTLVKITKTNPIGCKINDY